MQDRADDRPYDTDKYWLIRELGLMDYTIDWSIVFKLNNAWIVYSYHPILRYPYISSLLQQRLVLPYRYVVRRHIDLLSEPRVILNQLIHFHNAQVAHQDYSPSINNDQLY